MANVGTDSIVQQPPEGILALPMPACTIPKFQFQNHRRDILIQSVYTVEEFQRTLQPEDSKRYALEVSKAIEMKRQRPEKRQKLQIEVAEEEARKRQLAREKLEKERAKQERKLAKEKK
ncbi:hypothetical protein RUND412_011402 [Rhizina undulata]